MKSERKIFRNMLKFGYLKTITKPQQKEQKLSKN